MSQVRLRVSTMGLKAGSVVDVPEATAASLVENHHATRVAEGSKPKAATKSDKD